METTEVNPTLDHENKMSEAVIEILDIAAENLNKTDTSQWSPKL
jgi:hypothetical protein